MSVNTKRVFYVKYLAHPIYAELLNARPDLRLDRLENESPADAFAPVLAAAHVYQIGAARDELAPHFHVHEELLRRTPNLLIVSSNGAGFDPVDVEACTKAGVLVVNQSGGNAHSVAEHALGMLLTLSKRIIEADRALRRDPNVNRNQLMGTEARGKTIGIVGIGNVGRHRFSETLTGADRLLRIVVDRAVTIQQRQPCLRDRRNPPALLGMDQLNHMQHLHLALPPRVRRRGIDICV